MNLGLIDGQWALRRNFKAMEMSGQKLEYKNLVKTFYSSIAKFSEEFKLTNPVLLFDKWPYKKQEYISLKTSRYYPKESDLKEIPIDATPEEKAKIEAENEALRNQLANEAEFRHAKNFILKFSKEIGIPAISMVGYEADDLAYHIANNLGIKHDITFVTLDSDWRWQMGPTTTFCRCNKARDVYKKGVQTLNPEGVPLHTYGNLMTICSGNHNDIATMDIKYPLNDMCKAWAANDGQLEFYLGDKYEEFKIKMYALDCNNFWTDELKNYLLSSLEIDPRSYDEIDVREWASRHGIFVNFSSIGRMVKQRDRGVGLLDDPYSTFPKEVINEISSDNCN